MSDYTFVALSPEAARRLGLASLPIPARQHRLDAIMPQGGEVDLVGLIDELAGFLAENPHGRETYQQLLDALCYMVGVDAGARGYHEQAEHCFRVGLFTAPQNIVLRGNYALALHCLGRDVEAIREFERVVAGASKHQILPATWLMLARLYARQGSYDKSYWLLKDVSALIPDEPGFWDFFGEMGEKAGLAPTASVRSIAAEGGRQ